MKEKTLIRECATEAWDLPHEYGELAPAGGRLGAVCVCGRSQGDALHHVQAETAAETKPFIREIGS